MQPRVGSRSVTGGVEVEEDGDAEDEAQEREEEEAWKVRTVRAPFGMLQPPSADSDYMCPGLDLMSFTRITARTLMKKSNSGNNCRARPPRGWRPAALRSGR